MFFKEKITLLAMLFFFLSFSLCSIVACNVIAPAYRSPLSRTTTSKLGYPAMKRRAGEAFRVKVEEATKQSFVEVLLGEGRVSSQSILVPVIPMAKVKKLYVQEGDYVKKGALLIELDDTQARIKLASAKLAVQSAKAERDRVMIGSAYVLAQERPEKDKIAFETYQKEVTALNRKYDGYKKLFAAGAISKNELAELELEIVKAEKRKEDAKFHLGMSTKGQKQSIQIAKNALDNAQNAFEHRENEMRDFKIYAATDGIVERILIQEGEFNQDTGRPAIILAHGLWFEAHLNQSALGKIKVGQEAKVHLEAFSKQEVVGIVKNINPIVSYGAGGPEIGRPIRPRGSSMPEWPSTFTVKISLPVAGATKQIAPGLTGFARIESARDSTAVPLSALTSLSASSAVVKIPSEKSFSYRKVQIGAKNDSYAEVLAGLNIGESVIAEGGDILEPDDLIRISH